MSAPQNRPLADTLFIADFAAFCRTKGGERYDAYSTQVCALAQFLKSREPNFLSVGFTGWTATSGPRRDLPEAAGYAAADSPHTFSALADRLEALIADAPVVERA